MGPQASDVLEAAGARPIEELVLRFVPPGSAKHPVPLANVEAADRIARHWTSVEVSPLHPGSAEEECRHILFFANWLAWHRANLPWWRRIGFELRVAAVWLYIAWLRVGLARGMDSKSGDQDSNFTVNGAQAVTPVKIGFLDLLQLCLEENDRRLAGYDARLVRPATIPAVARFVLGIGKLWSRLWR